MASHSVQANQMQPQRALKCKQCNQVIYYRPSQHASYVLNGHLRHCRRRSLGGNAISPVIRKKPRYNPQNAEHELLGNHPIGSSRTRPETKLAAAAVKISSNPSLADFTEVLSDAEIANEPDDLSDDSYESLMQKDAKFAEFDGGRDPNYYLGFDVQEATKNLCQKAEELSMTYDRAIMTSSIWSRDKNGEPSDDQNKARMELDMILNDHAVTTAFTKRLYAWIRKNVTNSDELLGRNNSIGMVEDDLRIPVLSKEIRFAKGLRGPSHPGFTETIFYREPLLLIARMTTEILHIFGLRTFYIDVSQRDSYEFAQNAKFLKRVSRYFAADSDALIIPIKLHADGAHMRANGLHHITPVLVSIVFRDMYKDKAARFVPEVVTTIPNLPDLLTSDADSVKTSKQPAGKKKLKGFQSRKVTASFHHAVLMNLFFTLRVIWKSGGFIVQFKGQKIRCYPIIYKLAMDMPMMANCSFTKMSHPMQQRRPCQQCLIKGKRRSFYLYPNKIHYRHESMLYRCGFGAQTVSKERRKKYNIRHIGTPQFLGMNPFDARGIFLLAAADGLHAFKSQWLRGVITAGISAVYLNSRTDPDDENDPSSESESDSISEMGSDCNEKSSTDAGSETGSSSEEDDEPWSYDQDASLDMSSEDASLSTSSAQTDTDVVAGVVLPGLMKGAVATRVRRILGKPCGYELRVAASRAVIPTTSGSSSVPIRSTDLFDQVTLIQEHKYSLGLLLSLMATVGRNKKHSCMGVRYRKLWLAVALRSIIVYSLLYQQRPTSTSLNQARNEIKELLTAVDTFKSVTRYRWNAPKIHLLIHFPDMIEEFGRMRLFDTTDGETALSRVKKTFKMISNRQVWSYHEILLQKLELRSMAKFRKLFKDVQTTERSADICPVQPCNHISKPAFGSVSQKIVLRHRKKSITIVGTSSDLDQFPMKYADSSSRTSVIRALNAFLEKQIDRLRLQDDANNIITMEHRTSAIVFDGSASEKQFIAASESRYDRKQYDYVQFRSGEFGEMMMLADITLDTGEYNRRFEVVFWVPLLQIHDHEVKGSDCACKELYPVFIHCKAQRTGEYVRCSEISEVNRKVTIFKDYLCQGCSAENHGNVCPSGDCYFVVNPQVFKGIETYC